MQNDKCKTCEYWHKPAYNPIFANDTNPVGQCHLNPPDKQGAWAAPKADDWCSHHVLDAEKTLQN